MESMVADSCAQKFHIHGFCQLDVVPSDPKCDVHRRISSAARVILKHCWKFHRTLGPRQRAQFDLDDLLQESWLILLREDHLYDKDRFPPDTGGYIRFVGFTLKHRLKKIRRRSRVVDIPQKAHCILRDNPDSDAAVSIRRVNRGIKSLHPSLTPSKAPSAASEAARREEVAIARDTVSLGLGQLPEKDAIILSAYYIDGRSPYGGASLSTLSRIGYRDGRGLWRLRRAAEDRLARIIGTMSNVV